MIWSARDSIRDWNVIGFRVACARVIGGKLGCEQILEFGASLERHLVRGPAPVPISDVFHPVALVVIVSYSAFCPAPQFPSCSRVGYSV